MTTPPKDGGAAFPDPMRGAEQTFSNQSPGELPAGMSLRDFFAAHALVGLVAAGDAGTDAVAQDAYVLADAMLIERERRK